MNFNMNYHFADFEEHDSLWLKLIGAMLETDYHHFLSDRY